MSDPGFLICGISVNVIPLYKNAMMRKLLQRHLWNDGEVHDKLRRVLTTSGIASVSDLIRAHYKCPGYLRVVADIDGVQDEDGESDDCETFMLDLDVFGDPEWYGGVSAVLSNQENDTVVTKDLRNAVVGYVSSVCPEAQLEWKVEVDAYGE